MDMMPEQDMLSFGYCHSCRNGPAHRAVGSQDPDSSCVHHSRHCLQAGSSSQRQHACTAQGVHTQKQDQGWWYGTWQA